MARMPSNMSHQFSRVPSADVQRSSFDRTHNWKGTFNAGYLIPIYVDEVLPGDTFTMQMTCFGRLATPLHPFMDNLFVDTFFFFIPERLLWENWERFNGAQDNPDDPTDYVLPVVDITEEPLLTTGYDNSSLQDYMGIPPEVPGLEHRVGPLRAYYLVWNEWFRDENLQDSLAVPLGDGPDDPAAYVLQRRGKRHDYFTSALPWPQKGPAVDIPLGTTAPVVSTGAVPQLLRTGGSQFTDPDLSWASTTASRFAPAVAGAASAGTVIWGDTGLEADLSNATAATINSLRQAFQIQKMYERDARGGTRYVEILKSHFGVTSPDFRLQRPEYLGGGSTPLTTQEIPQTSATVAESPQGNLAAKGTITVSGHGFHKSFVEHGIILGLVSVRADLNYQQGLNRMWSRSTRFDFFWPALAHLGEQAVLNKEIYAQGSGDAAADAGVFGYQERYAEYRYYPSIITSQFRSSFSESLDTWHLAQDFASLPMLNEEFIVDDPPVQRVLAFDEESGYPQILFDSYQVLRSVRPMPVYSVPGLIDHF